MDAKSLTTRIVPIQHIEWRIVMMNIDKCKRYVLIRNGMYLTHDPLTMTNSAYNAKQYKDRREALNEAKLYQAKVRVFNPVTGEIACG